MLTTNEYSWYEILALSQNGVPSSDLRMTVLFESAWPEGPGGICNSMHQVAFLFPCLEVCWSIHKVSYLTIFASSFCLYNGSLADSSNDFAGSCSFYCFPSSAAEKHRIRDLGFLSAVEILITKNCNAAKSSSCFRHRGMTLIVLTLSGPEGEMFSGNPNLEGR